MYIDELLVLIEKEIELYYDLDEKNNVAIQNEITQMDIKIFEELHKLDLFDLKEIYNELVKIKDDKVAALQNNEETKVQIEVYTKFVNKIEKMIKTEESEAENVM